MNAVSSWLVMNVMADMSPELAVAMVGRYDTDPLMFAMQ